MNFSKFDQNNADVLTICQDFSGIRLQQIANVDMTELDHLEKYSREIPVSFHQNRREKRRN